MKILKVLRRWFRDDSRPISQPMDSDQFLVDFRDNRFGGITFTNVVTTTPADVFVTQGPASVQPQRIAVTPQSVVNELKAPPTLLGMDGLEDKIKILRMKEALIEQTYAKGHVQFMLQALTNRKKFDTKCKAVKRTYREFFSRFDVTNEEKISALCTKYELMHGSSELFVPEFPDDATLLMTEYRKAVKELTGKSPRFTVIATPKDFQTEANRRDPILLSQSPFGMYYYILGAWDKEMRLLSEL
jgi:hypothetical protein